MAKAIYTSWVFSTLSGVQVAPNAAVDVRRESDSGLAVIYEDADGLTQITQPGFAADADGYFEFYAAGLEGGYLITVDDGVSPSRTLRHQAVGTAQQFDASTYGGTLMNAANESAARSLLGIEGALDAGVTLISDGTDLRAVPLANGLSLVGGFLEWTVAGNALTVAIKAATGSPTEDPSTTNPVFVIFRDAAVTEGAPVIAKITSAVSITAPLGATFGTLANTAFRLWAVGFLDGATFRLGLINCLSGTAPSLNIYPLGAWPIASSELVTSSPAADSAAVFYTGVAVSSKPYSVLGYATWESGLGTAGTWSAGPTRKQLFGPGVPLPGQTIQAQRNQTGAVATGTTTIPTDDTIPQNTEGFEVMTQAITPRSTANILGVESVAHFFTGGNSGHACSALFQDSTANALAATFQYGGADDDGVAPYLSHRMRAGTTSSTTFKIRVGVNVAGTVTFNGIGGARKYGGVIPSFLQLTEVMA